MEEKTFVFTVDMIGVGTTPEEAWENCQEKFEIGFEEMPIEEKIEIEE